MGYKITELTALNQAPSSNDIIPVVDVSDSTQAASGSTKKMTVGELANAIGTGDTGVKGDTGSQGIQGVKGDTGDKGDTGTQGIKGDTGTFLAKGDTGDKGDTGTKGDTGVGGISFIYNETPSGTVNGSNKAFDTANNYVAGTIQVFRDGQLMKGGGDDYTETDSNTITFTTAPVSGSVLLVSYQKTTSTNGNADTVDGYNANATPTANNIPVLDSNAKMPISTVNPIHPLNAPEGFLINGKIAVSVASNNLTVALKTLAGNNPSSTDPIYVRIKDTVRTITSSLSWTLNAGTNYANAGSSELATKEIDYFVYLGWNTILSSVELLASRIPYATTYNDFNYTSTNEKTVFGYSGGNVTVTDDVTVIGRYAATLSAGAGYTWSVPTFTTTNLIQRPIYETRWISYVPTFTVDSPMTLSSTSSPSGTYKIINNTISIYSTINQAKSGSALTYGAYFSTPMSIAASNNLPIGGGTIDNFYGNVASYGGSSTKIQLRSSTSMSVDGVSRNAGIGVYGIAL